MRKIDLDSVFEHALGFPGIVWKPMTSDSLCLCQHMCTLETWYSGLFKGQKLTASFLERFPSYYNVRSVFNLKDVASLVALGAIRARKPGQPESFSTNHPSSPQVPESVLPQTGIQEPFLLTQPKTQILQGYSSPTKLTLRTVPPSV